MNVRARSPRMAALTWLLGASLGAGCSDNGADPLDAGGGGSDAFQDGLLTCARPNDPIDTYMPNLVKVGSNGVLTYTLVQSDNAPPIRSRNVWKLKITKDDAPATLGDVIPEVKMPYHTHPAGQQPKMTYDAAEGVYTADPVHFFMVGYWTSQFTMYQGSADDAVVVDRATFYFCVD